jgi:superfamily II DNA or RNA helicase
VRIPGPIPEEVRAFLAQRLFIEKEGLPSPLLNQIKRLAAFQNPEFYKKQSMRLSTALTPRVIACAEESTVHIGLPRGCQIDLENLLTMYDVKLLVEDRREVGKPIDIAFQGQLSTLQEQAAQALLQHDIGVFVAPPGVGKTVLGTYLIAARARNALILVHRQPLLEQWVAQLAMFLGVEEKSIGTIGGGKRWPTGRIDVAMIQSLVNRGEVDDLVAKYGYVIVDECHHLPAVSFERVLAEVKARYVTGLTATPARRDGHQPITEMQLGPFDDARLDALFLAMPISWKGTLVQYAGRLHRRHARKREVRIFDYVDRHVPVLARMFERRRRAYRAIGYERTEVLLDDDHLGEPIAEWDDDEVTGESVE